MPALCRLWPLRLALVFAACLYAPPASAQRGVYTPKPRSLERKLILDTLRPAVEGDLKRPVIFVVSPKTGLRVLGDWAFVDAQFRQPSGGPLPPKFFADRNFMVSDDAAGLLHRIGGRWRLVAHATGPTDEPWVGWDRKYHAPRAVFPPGV